VDATLIQSDNISITKASKDERSEKAKKIDALNDLCLLDFLQNCKKSKHVFKAKL